MSFLRGVQQLLIFPLYFKYPLFKIDWHFFLNYWNENPYKICQKYFYQTEKKEVFYGDTWPFLIPYFVQSVPVSKEDVFFDLGSGIGRISFWFQAIAKCQVVAVEKVPFFVEKAKKIQKKVPDAKIEFLQKDLLEVDYDRATLIYFYASSFDDDTILELIKKWESLKSGVRIITTSFALHEYGSSCYQVIKQFKASYPWGMCDVYLQIKV